MILFHYADPYAEFRPSGRVAPVQTTNVDIYISSAGNPAKDAILFGVMLFVDRGCE
ncbi:hypothetical protein BADSM9389_17990 [Buttiauxella agrestis]|nr:hypothetical protein BADSM9389_17990 [Buttiauxella agrestis]